jgi:hypothetical protein
MWIGLIFANVYFYTNKYNFQVNGISERSYDKVQNIPCGNYITFLVYLEFLFMFYLEFFYYFSSNV